MSVIAPRNSLAVYTLITYMAFPSLRAYALVGADIVRSPWIVLCWCWWLPTDRVSRRDEAPRCEGLSTVAP